jgi:NAD(P)H-hydrate epimerase
MASGGMGDVLTGIITALIAQGYAPFAACKLGAFLHGYAADLIATEKGEVGMSAVDVQEMLPYACKQLSS